MVGDNFVGRLIVMRRWFDESFFGYESVVQKRRKLCSYNLICDALHYVSVLDRDNGYWYCAARNILVTRYVVIADVGRRKIQGV